VGPPQAEFHRFFEDPKRHRKMKDFLNHQKSSKTIESIAPLTSKDGSWIKKHDFWAPFAIDFLLFFENGESVL